ncbi:hypothetical protein MTO96_020004 [Rhipicephalus appendiculatus]
MRKAPLYECVRHRKLLVFKGDHLEVYAGDPNNRLVNIVSDDGGLWLRRRTNHQVRFCTSPYNWEYGHQGLRLACFRHEQTSAVAVPLDTVVMRTMLVRGCFGWIDGSVLSVEREGAVTGCSNVNGIDGISVGTVLRERCYNDETAAEGLHICTADGTLRKLKHPQCGVTANIDLSPCEVYAFTGITICGGGVTSGCERAYVNVTPSSLQDKVRGGEDAYIDVAFFANKTYAIPEYPWLACARVGKDAVGLYSAANGIPVLRNRLLEMYASNPNMSPPPARMDRRAADGGGHFARSSKKYICGILFQYIQANRCNNADNIAAEIEIPFTASVL